MSIEALYKIYIGILSLMLGGSLGSFISCMVYREQIGKSAFRGRSQCDSCGHVLSWTELIPIFSYIFLKGKCRHCGERISSSGFFSELILAAAFLLLYLRFGISPLSLRYAAMTAVLLYASSIDINSYRIPNKSIITGLIIWLITLPFTAGKGGEYSGIIEAIFTGIIGAAAISGSMLLLSLAFDRLSGKESMGGGDLKLLFLTGLYLGLEVGLFSLILSCIFGLLTGALMKKNRIPFGPAISLAFFVSMLIGRELYVWYTGMIV